MEIFKNYLVLTPDYKSKIAFVAVEDKASSFVVDVDWNYPLNNAKPIMFLESSADEESKQATAKEDSQKCIHNIAVSEANNWLAFTTNEKSLFLCQIDGSSCKTLSRRYFLRTSSCIRFAGNSLFLADKTGDVFEYLCDEINYNKPGKWIFGHISQILDLKISPDHKYILTSDRDEKIRVTNSPAYHEIETFCLGHRQFVSSLTLLTENLLLSCSGDKTIRLWNFVSGKELSTTEVSFTPIILKNYPESAYKGNLCILTSDHAVKIYSYQLIDESALKLDLLGEKKYESDVEIAASKENFFIGLICDNKLFIEQVKIHDHTASFESLHSSDILNMLGISSTEPKTFKSFDVSILFKNTGRFDNVKEYIDRKKARIESQAMKKK